MAAQGDGGGRPRRGILSRVGLARRGADPVPSPPVVVTPPKAPPVKAPRAKPAPAKSSSAKAAPAKATRAKAAPVKAAPVNAAPVKAAPAKAAPPNAAPVKAAPVRAARAKAPPVKAPPVKAARAKATAPAAAPRPRTVSGALWTTAEVAEIRALLDGEARDLRREITEASEALDNARRDGADATGDDQADAGTATFEREHEMSLANNSRDLLQQTERALARLSDGTYGACEVCGTPIVKARLQAFPRATLCVSCKQREERR